MAWGAVDSKEELSTVDQGEMAPIRDLRVSIITSCNKFLSALSGEPRGGQIEYGGCRNSRLFSVLLPLFGG